MSILAQKIANSESHPKSCAILFQLLLISIAIRQKATRKTGRKGQKFAGDKERQKTTGVTCNLISIFAYFNCIPPRLETTKACLRQRATKGDAPYKPSQSKPAKKGTASGGPLNFPQFFLISFISSNSLIPYSFTSFLSVRIIPL